MIARRPRGLKPLLTGIALTGLAGVVIFAAVSWAATGTVRERGLVEFLVIFTALNAVLHPLARRRAGSAATASARASFGSASVPRKSVS